VSEQGYERPAIAGSGAIACGLAASATAAGKVRVLARSDASAWRAEEQAQSAAAKLSDGDPQNVKVTTDAADLVECDLVVEAIVEDLQTKVDLLAELGVASPDADLASTTSALRIGELGERSGTVDRLFGLHVFNPVPKMALVELAYAPEAVEEVRERARALCAKLGKTAVEVPDIAGFVVNRLLFPYLFSAVQFMEQTGMEPEAIDTCMRLGAGHPMGPLALLDYVGLDVSKAIGEAIESPVPQTVERLVSAGHLGKKTGRGLLTYS